MVKGEQQEQEKAYLGQVSLFSDNHIVKIVFQKHILKSAIISDNSEFVVRQWTKWIYGTNFVGKIKKLV